MQPTLTPEQAAAITAKLPSTVPEHGTESLALTVEASIRGIDNIPNLSDSQRAELKTDLLRRAEAAGVRQETDAEQNQREAAARWRLDPADTERRIADFRARSAAATHVADIAAYDRAADRLQAGLDRLMAARAKAGV